MNIIAKGKPMTVTEAVQMIADAFADAEKRDRQTLRDFKRLRQAIKVIKEGGHISGLRAQTIAAELEAMASRHKSERLSLHDLLVQEAKDAGIDLPSLPDEDPDDEGGVVVMGGGDR